MPEDKNKYGEFTQEDIQLYLSGRMPPARMNALERAALEDPFLADAIEGFANADLDKLSADVNSLKDRLSERVNSKAKVVPIWKKTHFWRNIAASAVILIGIGSTIYFLNTSSVRNIAEVTKKDSAAQLQNRIQNENKKSDSIISSSLATADSINLKSVEKDKRSQAKLSKREDTGLRPTENQIAAGKAAAPAEVERSDAKEVQANVVAPQAQAKADMAINKDSDRLYKEVPELKSADKALAEESNADFKSKKARNEVGYFANSKSIKGKVRDNNNNGIPFANIRVLKSNIEFYADAQGNFSLPSDDQDLDVSVKSVGHISTNASISAKNKGNTITLTPTTSTLQDIAANSSRFQNIKVDTTANEEDEASPVDGWDNYDLYLANNLRIPIEALNNDTHGDVELSFTVNKNGYLTDFKIEKGLIPACNKEAIRLVREGPKWQLKKELKYATVKLSVPFL
ncbi:MAG: hypothetical protein C5B52_17530 [Bacteroidetes bacterium]|nr:MAG: hypothetical protein C5B52_17530 [Bacteroidota bacterium]